jgi:hypothetical protein
MASHPKRCMIPHICIRPIYSHSESNFSSWHVLLRFPTPIVKYARLIRTFSKSLCKEKDLININATFRFSAIKSKALYKHRLNRVLCAPVSWINGAATHHKLKHSTRHSLLREMFIHLQRRCNVLLRVVEVCYVRVLKQTKTEVWKERSRHRIKEESKKKNI